MRSEFTDDMGFADSQLRWLLAYTLAGGEKRAGISLGLRGLKAYCPTYKVTLQLRRRVVVEGQRRVHKVGVPMTRYLFPRYLFVQLPASRPFDDVREANGIESLVLQDGVPAVIPCELIEDLQVASDMGLLDDDGEREPIFKAGDAVQIVLGPFADFPARLDALMPDSMARVVGSMFGRPFDATMPLDRLKHRA